MLEGLGVEGAPASPRWQPLYSSALSVDALAEASANIDPALHA